MDKCWSEKIASFQLMGAKKQMVNKRFMIHNARVKKTQILPKKVGNAVLIPACWIEITEKYMYKRFLFPFWEMNSPFIVQTWIPSQISVLSQICFILIKYKFWRFLKVVNVFSLFGYYLPLEKGMILHLNKPEYPSSWDALCKLYLK